MTYNRPDCVINAIESVRKQSFTNFTLIVSDNSTNSLTEELIRKTYIFPVFYYKEIQSYSYASHHHHEIS